MLAALLIFVFTIFTVFFVPNWDERREEKEENDARKTPQIKKLWSLAQAAMRERKPMKAEKALLTILKFDEKNAAAYNRLGILYAKEKHFKEAVECFEIAQSLDNNASSLHNVGLIYLETGKYEKAAMAFSQAIDIEGDQPGRYIAYAKALEKLGERSKAIEALETAYSLGPSTVILRHLLEIYENVDDQDNAELTRQRIETLQLEKAAAEAKNSKVAKKAVRRATRTEAKTAKAQAKAASAAARQTKKSAPKRAVRVNDVRAKELPKKRKII
jgi:tetratricopeptide (TPR) repeat protein